VKIYIACALTHVPRDTFQEYSQLIHRLGAALRQKGGHEVSYALVNSDPQLAGRRTEDRARLCYEWDRRFVQESQLVIAEATFPSTGLGIELQLAQSADIPIILCFKIDKATRAAEVAYENPDHARHMLQIGEGYVSLMALGLPNIIRVLSYISEDTGIAAIVAAVSQIENLRLENETRIKAASALKSCR
jgi:hypothetical protein